MHVRTSYTALVAVSALLGSISLAMAPIANANTEADGTKFWGSVQRDDAHIVSYYLTVPPGETATLTLGNGYRLEMRAASSDDANPASSIKVYDKSKQPLHERTQDGQSPMNVSGSYAICSGSVVFISPAPTEAPTCD